MNRNEIIAKKEAMDKHFMETVGWYSHYVPHTGSWINYHTHGLERSYGHKNIQICMPLSQQQAHGLANMLVIEIKKGKKFEAGVDYEGLMAKGYKVRFIEAKECGRSVLRLLIPDVNGKYEGKFAPQLENLDDAPNEPLSLEQD